MVLDSFERVLVVTNAYDDVALLGGDDKVIGELVGLSGGGVVANRLNSLRNVVEASPVVMTHLGDLSVYDISGTSIRRVPSGVRPASSEGMKHNHT